MRHYPVEKVYKLIEPGPIVLVNSFHKGRSNIMTMGFHMMMQHDPALIGVVIGPWDYSYKAIKATRECVIAIPGIDLAKKVVDIGNCTGEEIDKFKKFRLTQKVSRKIHAPLIEQCLANIESKVVDTRFNNQYNFFVLKAVNAWINPSRREKRTMHHQGNGTFRVDGKLLDLRERMVKWEDLID